MSERQERLQKLARDVGVNVVANLIAAAIIYLLGVLFGLFPSSAEAIGTSFAVVSGAVAFAIPTTRRIYATRLWVPIAHIPGVVITVALIVITKLHHINSEWEPRIDLLLGAWFLGVALIATVIGWRQRDTKTKRR